MSYLVIIKPSESDAIVLPNDFVDEAAAREGLREHVLARYQTARPFGPTAFFLAEIKAELTPILRVDFGSEAGASFLCKSCRKPMVVRDVTCGDCRDKASKAPTEAERLATRCVVCKGIAAYSANGFDYCSSECEARHMVKGSGEPRCASCGQALTPFERDDDASTGWCCTNTKCDRYSDDQTQAPTPTLSADQVAEAERNGTVRLETLATGEALDSMAMLRGLVRKEGETDADLRTRISDAIRDLARPADGPSAAEIDASAEASAAAAAEPAKRQRKPRKAKAEAQPQVDASTAPAAAQTAQPGDAERWVETPAGLLVERSSGREGEMPYLILPVEGDGDAARIWRARISDATRAVHDDMLAAAKAGDAGGWSPARALQSVLARKSFASLGERVCKALIGHALIEGERGDNWRTMTDGLLHLAQVPLLPETTQAVPIPTAPVGCTVDAPIPTAPVGCTVDVPLALPTNPGPYFCVGCGVGPGVPHKAECTSKPAASTFPREARELADPTTAAPAFPAEAREAVAADPPDAADDLAACVVAGDAPERAAAQVEIVEDGGAYVVRVFDGTLWRRKRQAGPRSAQALGDKVRAAIDSGDASNLQLLLSSFDPERVRL